MLLARVSMVVILGLQFSVPQSLASQQSIQHDSFYAVQDYDPERDPAADLEQVAARATAERKRILVVIGGNWCIDCLNLDWIIAKTPAVKSMLRKAYLIMKVNIGPENRNEEFLSSYPGFEWVPHFYVLDSDGSLLHSQDTRELELGRSGGERVFLRFLERWVLTGSGEQRAGSRE